MKNVIVFCGKKQSGKSSSAKLICGSEMMRLGMFDNLNISDNGDVGTTNPNGTDIIIDFDSKNLRAIDFFSNNLWPTVRKFSFADRLKLAVNQVFSISPSLMYGTDEEKNSLTHVKLSDLFGMLDVSLVNSMKKTMSPDDFLSIRKLLQLFGTNICRRIDDKCWINGLLNDITDYGSELSIVDDCRFKNEVYAMREFGAIIIKFDRSAGDDIHSSEKDLDDIDLNVFDLVIDNRSMTLLDKNELVVNWLQGKGIISKGYQESGITRAKLV